MRAATPALILVLALAGCETSPDAATAPSVTGPTAPPVGQAYLSVSDTAPRPGTSIVVVARVSAKAGSSGIASYRMRVRYDTTSLVFAGVNEQPDVMQAVNPKAGEIIVAGVNTKPSPELTLVVAQFVARTTVRSLRVELVTDELNDTAYRNVLPGIPTSAQLRVDRALLKVPVARLSR